MNKQIIVSISREYGSAGHEIGRKLAVKLGIPFYDRNILEEVANEKNVSVESLDKYDEKPKHLVFSRTVRGFSNNPMEAVANLQFEHLLTKARNKESFVVIGRCSDEIFDGIPDIIVPKIFICGDTETKIERVETKRKMDLKTAEKALARHDKNRAEYHSHFCKRRWGIASTYDLSINSSRLGIEGTIDFLYNYIQSLEK